eukprot:scaffold339_cov298-Pavlova_lutheri.AAC.4
MVNEPSVRARQLQLDVRAIAIRAQDGTRSAVLDGRGGCEQDTFHEGDGGQMDLVEELRGSTYMKDGIVTNMVLRFFSCTSTKVAMML